MLGIGPCFQCLVYHADIMAQPLHKCFHYDECRFSTRCLPTLIPCHPTWTVSPAVCCYHPHPPSPFITITQPETQGGRLIQLTHGSKVAQGCVSQYSYLCCSVVYSVSLSVLLPCLANKRVQQCPWWDCIMGLTPGSQPWARFSKHPMFILGRIYDNDQSYEHVSMKLR